VTVKSDIEIARAATMKPIAEVAAKVGIPADALVPYGTTKAKVTFDYINALKDRPDGKLILVTAVTPTPAGKARRRPRSASAMPSTASARRR
jgi:formate--tetrahydrofolate ligase